FLPNKPVVDPSFCSAKKNLVGGRRGCSTAGLFDNLVDGLARSYGLDTVTLVLLDPEHEVRHLLLFNNPTKPLPEGVIFCDALDAVSPIYPKLVGPLLGPYLEDRHGAMFTMGVEPKSVAVLPLSRHGKTLGSLNFGSRDAPRFTRYHATDFLAHLAVIASFCLENNINRSRLIWAGLTDVLTGWHNRRYVDARLPEEFALAARNGQHVSFLLFDLDHFKQVNDEHGHETGDNVLREVARRVQKEIRLSDVAARWGGEEFLVVLPQTGLKDALQLAERIRNAVCATPIRANEQTALTVTVSIGAYATMPGKPEADGYDKQVREAINRADQAMYAAKDGGRNRVSIAPD
ncbi:MAG: diguanylate cyclase, partial [Pseudomonadota bacterium]